MHTHLSHAHMVLYIQLSMIILSSLSYAISYTSHTLTSHSPVIHSTLSAFFSFIDTSLSYTLVLVHTRLSCTLVSRAHSSLSYTLVSLVHILFFHTILPSSHPLCSPASLLPHISSPSYYPSTAHSVFLQINLSLLDLQVITYSAEMDSKWR